MNTRVPAETFPPGEYLREEIDARGWTQTEFAEIISRPPRVVNEIIAAKRSITPETAHELSAALGTSAQFWMNLETAYQLSKARPAAESIARKASLRAEFPVREMVKRGWIEDVKDVERLEASVLAFFGLKSRDGEVRFPHAARRNYKDQLTLIQQAWLFRVKQLADAIPSKPYSKASLTTALATLETLLGEPEEARHVGKLMADCGVRFVVVEPLPGSKIDGVCFWTNNKRSPVIGMTLRFDRNDNFWFVLRHEIEHVLRDHAKDGLIVDEDLTHADRDVNEEEKIANEAAQEFCTPRRELIDFVARVRPYFSEEKVIRFAKRIGRHPGIVVGQLQNELGRRDLLNKMKAKIRKFVIDSTFTDGWGAAAPI